MIRRKKIRVNIELSYIYRLFISYFVIVTICIGIMAVFSYRLESNNIKSWAIKSNNDLLNHFKGTMDSLILDNIDKSSMLVLQNAINNSDVSYYFSNSVEHNYIGVLKVIDLLKNIKAANPLISSITIYFNGNNLLVSTDGVKYSPDDNSIMFDRGYIYKLFNDDVKQYWGLKKERLTATPNPDPSILSEINFITYIRKITSLSSLPNTGGSITISVDETVLHSLIKGSAPTNFGQILIIDENGNILSHSNKDYLYKNISTYSFGEKIMGKMTKSSSGYLTSKIEGTDNIISYVASDYNNWNYITLQPIAQLTEAKLKYLGQTMVLIAIVTLIFGLIISLLSSKSIYSPLKRLSDICKNILIARSSEATKDECTIIGSTLGILSEKVKEQEEKLEQSIPIIKHHFIQSLLHSNTLNEETIYIKTEFLGINLHFDYFTVIILKIRDIHSAIGFETSEMLKLHIIEKIDYYLTGQNMQSICNEANDSINIILNTKSEDCCMIININNLIKHIENELHINVNIGIGNTYKEFENIVLSYKEAVNCINYSYIYPEVNIFTVKETSAWEHNLGENLKHLYDAFCISMKSGDRKSSSKDIFTIIKTIRTDHISYNNALKMLTQCVTFIEDTISDLKINPNTIIKSDIYTDFNNISNITYLANWFDVIINQVFSQIDEKKSQKNANFIMEVKDYILDNILEPSLSLNYVAEVMHISPAYLSRMFKKETGMTFVEYLMDCKLNTAKNLLLLNTDMKIDDLCNTIGYSSPQYFIRKFKIKFGSTPSEYRLTHIREINT